MDPSAENRINLATLQRYDRFVTAICATAKQTTLYQYKSKSEEWERTDVDGACFVYQRSAEPFYAFMILNRLGTENFVEPIQPNIDFMRQDPFLLYRTPKSIYGIWFYDSIECDRVSFLLDKLVTMKKIDTNATAPPVMSNCIDTRPRRVAPPAGSDNAGSAILQMLSKAQSNYDKKSEPPSVTSKPTEAHNLFKPQPIKPEGNDERKSINIEEFFKTASKNFNEKSATSEDTPPPGHAFHRPPQVHNIPTVTDLEKEHPSVNPAELVTPASLSNIKTANSSLAATNSLLDTFAPQMQTPSKNTAQSDAIGDTLMSPMAFSVPSSTAAVRTRMTMSPQLPPETSPASSSQVTAMAADSDHIAIATNPLTKDQLLQAFEYLLKTDDNFIHSLHNAYIDSLKVSMKR